MRRRRYLVASCGLTAMLAGCGGSQSLSEAPSATPQSFVSLGLPKPPPRTSVTERLIYSFRARGNGGYFPTGRLLYVNGTLYGTAEFGGASGVGQVFKIGASGHETVLHNFGDTPDGALPFAGLINMRGTLYGTTLAGGRNGSGTVFRITPSGTETVLYSFPQQDGSPYGALLGVNGTMYGTTGACCGNGHGTVFSITPSGRERVLHRFSGVPDGAFPLGNLIDVKGTLYGTTFEGGTGSGYGCFSGSYNLGCGTVFSITTAGVERVVYSFAGSPDGERPRAGLTEVDGTLYGTTSLGGRSGYSYGTVFAVTPLGNETVLHSFTGRPDGAAPGASLLNVNGVLYGTTYYGGHYKCHRVPGCGTIFRITPSGNESIFHSFSDLHIASHPDGALPSAALIDVKGILYGTTESGGVYRHCREKYSTRRGCGTIFEIAP